MAPPPNSWRLRSELASYLIRPDDIVCDLGAGAQYIREILPQSVGYIPVDCVKEHEDTVVLDLNGDFALPDRPFNVIICLGLIRYLDDVPKFFRSLVAKQEGKFIIFTIGFKKGVSKLHPFSSLDEGLSFFSQYVEGLRIVSCISAPNERYMFCGTLGTSNANDETAHIPSLAELTAKGTGSINISPNFVHTMIGKHRKLGAS